VKDAKESGFYCKVPKYGFGDAVSCRFIAEAIEATVETGAIRHGAECFNYLFPQELDDEYLVVWEGFDGKAWEYLEEDELREFLIERAGTGFIFPLNPVWIVRDLYWYDVYQAMNRTEEGKAFLRHYLSESLGMFEQIEAIHSRYPDCFLAYGTGFGCSSRKSLALDMETSERVTLALTRLTLGEKEDTGEVSQLASECLGEPELCKDADIHLPQHLSDSLREQFPGNIQPSATVNERRMTQSRDNSRRGTRDPDSRKESMVPISMMVDRGTRDPDSRKESMIPVSMPVSRPVRTEQRTSSIPKRNRTVSVLSCDRGRDSVSFGRVAPSENTSCPRLAAIDDNAEYGD
jgi:hypothetical protein